MVDPTHSERQRLPAHQLDLPAFDGLLGLFEAEFDHLICQADLPTTSVITEDPHTFRDSLSEQPLATNIRVRGWSRTPASAVRLGELILSDHRAEIRVDGYPDRTSARAFLTAVRLAVRTSRRRFGWVFSPWLVAAGTIAGGLAGIAVGRGLGLTSAVAALVAVAPGLLIGLALPLIVAAIAQLATPYAAVRGLGLCRGQPLAPRPADSAENAGRGAA